MFVAEAVSALVRSSALAVASAQVAVKIVAQAACLARLAVAGDKSAESPSGVAIRHLPVLRQLPVGWSKAEQSSTKRRSEAAVWLLAQQQSNSNKRVGGPLFVLREGGVTRSPDALAESLLHMPSCQMHLHLQTLAKH